MKQTTMTVWLYRITVVALLALNLCAVTHAQSNEVRAQRLVIVDQSGKRTCVVDGNGLHLLDPKGEEYLTAGQPPYSRDPTFSLNIPGDKLKFVTVGANSDEFYGLVASDGKHHVSVGVDGGGIHRP